jgi:MYXO-CTERM domain-containing protein
METEMVSYYEMGMAGEVLPFLGFIALMGLLGLLAIVLHRRRAQLGKIFMWISASAMLAASFLFAIGGIGLFFFPAAILLIIGAVGLRAKEDKGGTIINNA